MNIGSFHLISTSNAKLKKRVRIIKLLQHHCATKRKLTAKTSLLKKCLTEEPK